MDPALLAGLIVAGVAPPGTIGNEASHGGLAETMGLGHRHLADYGGSGMHHMGGRGHG